MATLLPKPVVFSTAGINFDDNGQQVVGKNPGSTFIAPSPSAVPSPAGVASPAKNVPVFSSRSRKSKSEALSKLAEPQVDELSGRPKQQKPSAPPPPPAVDLPVPKNNPARQFLAKPRATPLGFENICTQAPRNLPTRSEGRLFGLEHCPVFYPTEEEFAQPLKYIEDLVEKSFDNYGLVKVVPPPGWKPTFSLNSEVFIID